VVKVAEPDAKRKRLDDLRNRRDERQRHAERQRRVETVRKLDHAARALVDAALAELARSPQQIEMEAIVREAIGASVPRDRTEIIGGASALVGELQELAENHRALVIEALDARTPLEWRGLQARLGEALARARRGTHPFTPRTPVPLRADVACLLAVARGETDGPS
jgi:hypothetical protein